jgi:hypothetical protein
VFRCKLLGLSLVFNWLWLDRGWLLLTVPFVVDLGAPGGLLLGGSGRRVTGGLPAGVGHAAELSTIYYAVCSVEHRFDDRGCH